MLKPFLEPKAAIRLAELLPDLKSQPKHIAAFILLVLQESKALERDVPRLRALLAGLRMAGVQGEYLSEILGLMLQGDSENGRLFTSEGEKFLGEEETMNAFIQWFPAVRTVALTPGQVEKLLYSILSFHFSHRVFMDLTSFIQKGMNSGLLSAESGEQSERINFGILDTVCKNKNLDPFIREFNGDVRLGRKMREILLERNEEEYINTIVHYLFLDRYNPLNASLEKTHKFVRILKEAELSKEIINNALVQPA